jgi:hypothetical protein
MHLHRLRSSAESGRLAAALGAAAAYLLGVALVAPALYGAFLLLLIGGDCDDDGHVSPWMWAVGATVFVAFAAWSVRRIRRVWWGLPLATLAAALLVVALANVVNGSTGACLS